MAAISEESARRLTGIAKGHGDNLVDLAEWAISEGIPKKCGMSADDWFYNELGGHLRLRRIDRPKKVAELAEKGLSNVQIADILGVGEATVRRDKAELAGSSNDEDAEPSEQFTDDETSPNDDDADDLDIPEPDLDTLEPAKPGWHQLGDHRLYCGDSTDTEFINACTGAAFAFADPPYNAGKAEWDTEFAWNHDYLTETAAIVAVTPGIASLATFLTKTTMPYRWSMAAEINNGMTRGALGFGNWIAVTLFANGSIYRRSKDVYRIPAATTDDRGGQHPSRKPIRLLTHLIGLFTSKGDTVVDPFLGSGSTLLAANLEGRRCVGAEINPDYCAAIIARYQAAR